MARRPADPLRRWNRLRTAVQFAFAALTNGYAAGFARGTIYKGPTKMVCLPGLNCYSCPGALGACPIGAFQAVLADRNHWFAFYVAGFLMLVGACLGRLVCGWLCPFGLVQDLLYRIPLGKKRKTLPWDRWLRFLKYGVLIAFVIVLPLSVLDLVGQGQPWFCKWICPSGTLLAGLPLVAANPGLRQAVSWLFGWKTALLLGIVTLSVWFYRPFCRYLCPLGAIYGLFNPVALYRYELDPQRCTGCGSCRQACPMDIPVHQSPNSPECIRCGRCRKACPHGAIRRAPFSAGQPAGRQANKPSP